MESPVTREVECRLISRSREGSPEPPTRLSHQFTLNFRRHSFSLFLYFSFLSFLCHIFLPSARPYPPPPLNVLRLHRAINFQSYTCCKSASDRCAFPCSPCSRRRSSRYRNSPSVFLSILLLISLTHTPIPRRTNGIIRYPTCPTLQLRLAHPAIHTTLSSCFPFGQSRRLYR